MMLARACRARLLAGDLMRALGCVIRADDIELPHLILKGCSFESEALCRASSTTYPGGGAFQSVDDDLPLGLLKG